MGFVPVTCCCVSTETNKRASAPVQGVSDTSEGAGAGDASSSSVSVESGPVSGPIGSYNPLRARSAVCLPEEWVAVGPVVRDVVSRLDGVQERAVRRYLSTMTQFAVWAFREGLPLDADVLLSHQVIDTYVRSVESSPGTIRSRLRRLAAANGVMTETTGLKFDRPRYMKPYSVDEVRSLLSFASSHSNETRRRQLTGFVLLGAGCGFSRSDLRGVSRGDVHRHGDVLHVRAKNRCVPVLDVVVDDFNDYLDWCGDDPFVGVKTSTNITDRMVSWVRGSSGVPHLSGDRLRAFFIVEHLLRGTPVSQLMAICGFVRLEPFDKYLEFLPSPETSCGFLDTGVS